MLDSALQPAAHFERSQWPWRLLLILVGLLALGLRLYYVTHVVVFQPANQPKAHGDAVQYYNYARNLVQHGVFSADAPGALPPVSDSFRDPGYPVFLAAWMKVFAQWDSWYAAVLISQAVLGALTVLLWLCVGKRSLSTPWLFAAGVVMAIWPHSVAMGSDLMTETLYGFLVALSLFFFGRATDRNSIGWALAAGVCFSLAALTNAVLLPFAILLSLYMLVRRRMRARAVFVVIATAVCLTSPWMIRNAMLPAAQSSSSDRALMNFVQGSWPLYHSATKASLILNDPRATAVVDRIDEEIHVIEDNRVAGLSLMLQRMAQAPASYLLWYMRKPALLWGWNIRVGAGDIYFHVTYHSPFDVNPFWRAVAALCRAFNTPLMLLALTGCLLTLRLKQHPHELEGAALLLLFVTTVHSVLQAEPRYSIPYRGAEVLLAAWGACWVGSQARDFRNLHSRINH